MTSIAWSTVALLVFLLPGFFFFVGLAAPEQFSRETALKNPLSQLAAVVFVAFLVHGVLFLLSGLLPGSWPSPDLRIILESFQFAAGTSDSLREVAANLEKWRLAVFSYVLIGVGFGFALGYGWGWLSVRFPWARRFSQHSWIYDVAVGNRKVGEKKSTFSLTYAFVLSNVEHDEKKLLYRGVLKTFGLSQEGKFAYLVLLNPHRFYMLLKDDYPSTTQIKAHIGATHKVEGGTREEDETQFVVEGSSVANVLFERWAFLADKESVALLARWSEVLRKPRRSTVSPPKREDASDPKAEEPSHSEVESPSKPGTADAHPHTEQANEASRES